MKNISNGETLFPNLTESIKKGIKVNTNICIFILEERKRRKMSQTEFAKFLGVTQGLVSRWESGEYNFTIKKMVEIFDKLGYKVDLKKAIVRKDIYLIDNTYYNILNDIYKTKASNWNLRNCGENAQKAG